MKRPGQHRSTQMRIAAGGAAAIVWLEIAHRKHAARLGAVALGLLMHSLGSPAQSAAGAVGGLGNSLPSHASAAAPADNLLPVLWQDGLPAGSDVLPVAAATGSPPIPALAPLPAAIPAPPARAPDPMAALDDQHTLASGDILSFRIVEDEEDPRTLTVTDAGDLEIPCLGRFPAGQRTCKQLALALKTALEQDYYYQATVLLAVNSLARSRGKVYLVGPIRTPGVLELPSDEVLTVGKAILRAGGFTDFADRKHVKITRAGGPGQPGKETRVVDVGQIYDAGRTELDVALQPGDLIYIPERWVRF